MPSSHRKRLLVQVEHHGDDPPRSDSPPNIPPSYLPPPPHFHPKPNSPIIMSFMALAVAASLLLGFLVVRIRQYCLGQNGRGSSSPVLFSMHVDSRREDDRGRVDHPIFSINTVGLDQSCIDSIAVCEFKKGDGLIDGTECTICLGEFEEGDDLRLLPKCNHAFHVPCIDTWLRSHKNCPLCRAPVVRDVPLPCRGVNLEESCLNRETLERSSTAASGRDNAGEGGFRDENEVRKEKGICPSVMQICRTTAIDNHSPFTKEARRASDVARASKNGESSHHKIWRSSSDAGILSIDKTSRQTPSHLF